MLRSRVPGAAPEGTSSKPVPDQAAVEALVDALADRPYGESKKAPEKARPLTISLPPSLIAKLEDAALANKRGGTGPKNVSAIVRQGLAAIGFIDE